MAKKKSTQEQTSEYTVLARRYRPQQFADLIGQEPVVQGLMNALQTNRVAHAYLFTGARGVGKTSAARILAKALNCAKGPTVTPCDECELCRAIASGDDIDVLEIDGASNRGIDEVREIRQNVSFRPSRARYKIYIIDEVHMLTGPAFNALLKTLEEPPPHVKFIFATTEAGKIPITILSRCQRFDFAGIGTSRIVERLKEIVQSEGMKADDEALEIVARRAGGSMRDSQSLLDQLLAFGGERLTVDQVHQLLGTANEERVAALAAAVLSGAAAPALEQLDAAAEQGLQLGEFLDQLIEYWRDLMVVSCAGLENQTVSVTGKHRDALREQAKRLSTDTILAGLDILVSARSRMRVTSHGRALVEMALVRLSRIENLISLTQLTQMAVSGKAPPPPSLPSKPASLPTSAEKKKVAADTVPEVGPFVNAAHTTSATPISIGLTKDNLPEVWKQVLEQSGIMVASELRKSQDVAISGPNTLALRFPPGYNQQGAGYLDANRLAKVEELLSRITGQACNIRVESGSLPSPNGVDGGQLPQAEGAAAKARRQRADITAQVPLVSKAVDLLGAQIIQMDEGFGALPVAAAPQPADSGATEE